MQVFFTNLFIFFFPSHTDRAKYRATNTTNTMIADTDRKKGEEHTDGTMKGRSSAGKSTSEKKPRKPRVQKLPKSMLFNKRDLPSLYTVQLEDINLDETVHENFLRIVRMRFPDDHPLRFLAEYVNSRQIGDTSMTLTEEQFRSFGAEKSLEFHFRKSQSYFNQLYSIMLRREEPNQFNKYQGVPPTLVFDFRNMFDVFRVLLPHLFNCYTYLESHVSYMRDNLSKWSKTFKSSAAEKREN